MLTVEQLCLMFPLILDKHIQMNNKEKQWVDVVSKINTILNGFSKDKKCKIAVVQKQSYLNKHYVFFYILRSVMYTK